MTNRTPTLSPESILTQSRARSEERTIKLANLPKVLVVGFILGQEA